MHIQSRSLLPDQPIPPSTDLDIDVTVNSENLAPKQDFMTRPSIAVLATEGTAHWLITRQLCHQMGALTIHMCSFCNTVTGHENSIRSMYLGS